MPKMRAMHRIALNVDLGAEPGVAPLELELIPAGPEVVGRDGRRWLFDDSAASAVMDAFSSRGIDLPVDFEHATQLRAPNGEAAPAAGWITGLSIRDGALWGAVTWTADAAAQIAQRAYRYISPVFDYSPSTNRIARMVSAGLTNLPNLRLQALNQEQPMNRSAALVAAIAASFSLAATATDDELATAINTMKKGLDDETLRATNAERNAATPSLERFVPRADHDAALARASNAENALRDRNKADHKASVDAAIDGALKAGKITPASVEYYTATCSDAEGLERFKAFVSGAPVVAPDGEPEKKKPGATSTALNQEERAVCQATGISPEDFIKQRDAAAA